MPKPLVIFCTTFSPENSEWLKRFGFDPEEESLKSISFTQCKDKLGGPGLDKVSEIDILVDSKDCKPFTDREKKLIHQLISDTEPVFLAIHTNGRCKKEKQLKIEAMAGEKLFPNVYETHTGSGKFIHLLNQLSHCVGQNPLTYQYVLSGIHDLFPGPGHLEAKLNLLHHALKGNGKNLKKNILFESPNPKLTEILLQNKTVLSLLEKLETFEDEEEKNRLKIKLQTALFPDLPSPEDAHL